MTAEDELRQLAEAEPDALRRACVRAELAAYLARKGAFEEAAQIVGELRSGSTWISSRLTAMIMHAEALISLRNEYSQAALDRLSRGFAIAHSFQDYDVAALMAAWLAQFNYNKAARPELRKWVEKCLALRGHMTRQARARFSLTQASIAGYTGDRSAANAWYQVARHLAVALKDEPFLAAAMYNRPALAISRDRVDVACGRPPSYDLEQLLLEISSAVNYTSATGNTAATGFHRLWLGRLRLLIGDAKQAGELINDALGSMPEAQESHVLPTLLADLSICALRNDDVDEAAIRFNQLPKDVDRVVQVDDAVVYYSQLAEIAQRIGETAAFSEAQHRRECALGEYAEAVDELRACLTSCEPSWADMP
jgi:hypothetical protein